MAANPQAVLQPPPASGNLAQVTEGKARYHHFCGTCHGDSAVSGGVLPDLRYSAALGNPEAWNQVVRDGALQANGMVAFSSELSQAEIDAVRAYVIARAREDAAKTR
jgi:alcohol dehydrogenase (cytochrome c)/quinohemoprotein ethanol dehydrogenase